MYKRIALCCGYRVFPWVKAAEAWYWHPHHSSVGLEMGYTYSSAWSMYSCIGMLWDERLTTDCASLHAFDETFVSVLPKYVMRDYTLQYL